ncbi:unnamed protein product [Calypogeia fissa]
MSYFFNSLLTCLFGADEANPYCNLEGKCNIGVARSTSLTYLAQRNEKTSMVAEDVFKTLMTSSDCGPKLESQLQALVGKSFNNKNNDLSSNGWRESIALAIFSSLENVVESAVKAGVPMGKAMADAYQKVKCLVAEMAQETVGFAEEHPVYVTLLALGILVCLAPWAVEVLGFAELGPIEGSFAAWWHARFAGYVPKGSLFSFLQRLGMVWRRYV